MFYVHEGEMEQGWVGWSLGFASVEYAQMTEACLGSSSDCPIQKHYQSASPADHTGVVDCCSALGQGAAVQRDEFAHQEVHHNRGGVGHDQAYGCLRQALDQDDVSKLDKGGVDSDDESTLLRCDGSGPGLHKQMKT